MLVNLRLFLYYLYLFYIICISYRVFIDFGMHNLLLVCAKCSIPIYYCKKYHKRVQCTLR